MSGPSSDLTAVQWRQIRDAFARAKEGRRSPRRHPAEVTSDRLAEAAERWNKDLSGAELDAISVVWNALERIAGGTR